MNYNKDRYIIRQQALRIRSLEDELSRLKADRVKIVVPAPTPVYPILYSHYISVWLKGDRLKFKVMVTPCYYRLGYEDCYGWMLVDKYIQLSFIDLLHRYSYNINVNKVDL